MKKVSEKELWRRVAEKHKGKGKVMNLRTRTKEAPCGTS